jgi:hypothetical protein
VRASQLIRVLGRVLGGVGKGRCSYTAVNEVELPHEVRQGDTWLANVDGAPLFYTPWLHDVAAR